MMFGTRRAKEQESIDWPSLHALLEDDDRRAATEIRYPDTRRESFLSALRRLGLSDRSDQVLAAGRQLHTAAKLVDWPTVAVAGMLNSGKTSLVATFLSDHGRARTLRGANNDQGTHRFVLWLPEGWKENAELWGLLMTRITDAIGEAPEMLASDPAEAHAQYNNRSGNEDSLAVPLVATDPNLDSVGIGLLDCPDIVSDEAFGLGSPELRRELLGRAATLCSAFLVVSSAESSRDATLGDLMRIASDLMPGVPRMLAVNKIRSRQTPDQVHETFGPLARSHGIETMYAAYDFEVPSSRPFIPIDKTNGPPDPEDLLPVFFSVSENPDDNPPASIEDERFLSALPGRLDRGVLFEKFQVALQESLRATVWENAMRGLETQADESTEITRKAQTCLLRCALEFFAHREAGEVTELRLHQSERIVRQLTESFARTAPWYARMGVRLNTRLRRFFGGASDFVKQLTPSSIARRTAQEVRDKFRRGDIGGLITPESLVQALDRSGCEIDLVHWNGVSLQEDRQRWLDTAEQAILRFERDDFTGLDPDQLDEATRQMWTEVPTHKKLAAGLTPLAALLAAFGGVLMLPIDFGSTTAFMSASIPELLAAAGLTTLSTMWAGDQSSRNVGHQAARQQLADFHAVLCDTFGVARPLDSPTIRLATTTETLADPKISQLPTDGLTLPLYHMRDEFRHELQSQLPRNPANS